jgi:hypothetical protein
MTLGAGAADTDDLTERLRAAVRSEAYEEVLELLGEYHCRFEQLLQEASGDPEESRRLFTEARELLEWAKATSLANRAHSQVSLRRLTQTARYMPAKAAYTRAWRLEA